MYTRYIIDRQVVVKISLTYILQFTNYCTDAFCEIAFRNLLHIYGTVSQSGDYVIIIGDVALNDVVAYPFNFYIKHMLPHFSK